MYLLHKFLILLLLFMFTNAHDTNLLELPDSASSESQKLEVNGDSISLDDMGPIIINTDG